MKHQIVIALEWIKKNSSTKCWAVKRLFPSFFQLHSLCIYSFKIAPMLLFNLHFKNVLNFVFLSVLIKNCSKVRKKSSYYALKINEQFSCEFLWNFHFVSRGLLVLIDENGIFFSFFLFRIKWGQWGRKNVAKILFL